MTEKQLNSEPDYRQSQSFQSELTDNQTQPGNFQEEGSVENRDRNFEKEFPERTHQHDYKTPSANQNVTDEEDEADTDGEIYNQDVENNINSAN